MNADIGLLMIGVGVALLNDADGQKQRPLAYICSSFVAAWLMAFGIGNVVAAVTR